MQPHELLEPIDDKFHISSDAVNTDDRVHVLNHSNTFALFDRWGNIYPHSKMVQGIYHYGTRFLNKLILTINGHKPLLLDSTIKEDNDMLSVDLTNPAMTACNIPDNTIHISRNQFVREGGYFEEIACYHYGEHPCDFDIELSFNADFRDIFEIRGITRSVLVNKVTYQTSEKFIKMEYLGQDGIWRRTLICFHTPSGFTINKNKVTFKINLKPDKPLSIQYAIYFLIGDEETNLISYTQAKESIQIELIDNRSLFADIQTSNEQFNHWLTRSRVDLLSLLARTDKGLYPYAGVPWFNTTFGRDGLITAIQTLWIAPQIAKNVLLYLAEKQATELIPEKDAEPGKILHEARMGEMANTAEIPFKEYYGTIDATPLFVMLSGMYYERTADLDLIKEIWPNIKAAINWINAYGDLDGDGFVEYQHKAKNGLTNQGWKDSFDSIMYEDGMLAEPPITLCEVQGYVYGAKQQAAKLAVVLGEDELSNQLYHEAADLKKNFNDMFWDEGMQCYVLALDAHKNKCQVIASNAGHCLFTRIVDSDKAERLANRLLRPDIFSGWGIRTLSENEKRYNPMSYHNGSIWPHDNALIAYGLSLYGFQSHALKVLKAIFDASLFIPLQRLPELYCGFDRRPGEGPTAYPVACSPQAWSVAVVFMLLQACLRVEINAITKTITFSKPLLPEFLKMISINQLRLKDSFCSLSIKRMKNDAMFNLLEKPEDWELVIKK